MNLQTCRFCSQSNYDHNHPAAKSYLFRYGPRHSAHLKCALTKIGAPFFARLIDHLLINLPIFEIRDLGFEAPYMAELRSRGLLTAAGVLNEVELATREAAARPVQSSGCQWCDEGNPRTKSSVSTSSWVHTDTPVGRQICTTASAAEQTEMSVTGFDRYGKEAAARPVPTRERLYQTTITVYAPIGCIEDAKQEAVARFKLAERHAHTLYQITLRQCVEEIGLALEGSTVEVSQC